jgi:hypothetical protein
VARLRDKKSKLKYLFFIQRIFFHQQKRHASRGISINSEGLRETRLEQPYKKLIFLTSLMFQPLMDFRAQLLALLLYYKKRTKMTATEFNELPINRRSDLIWEWGNFIISEKKEDHNKVLFTLEDMFVEVAFSVSDPDKRSITAVQNTDICRQYSDKVGNRNVFFNKMCLLEREQVKNSVTV